MHRGSWLVIAALLATACARGRAAGADAGPPEPPDSPVVLNVTNHYALQVDVFAVGAGTAYRMGTVAPGLAGRFLLRQAMLGGGPVEFLAQPVNGDPAIRSGPLLLAPGAIVDFEIAAQPLNSTATVRP